MSSGVASRLALYSSKSAWRRVGAPVSKATAMCVGFSFRITSYSVLVKPNMAEVFKPVVVKRGLLIIA